MADAEASEPPAQTVEATPDEPAVEAAPKVEDAAPVEAAAAEEAAPTEAAGETGEGGAQMDTAEETATTAETETVKTETAETETVKTETVEKTETEGGDAAMTDEDKEKAKTAAKFNRVCPSVFKGETCWALSKGKVCHYAVHDSSSGNLKTNTNTNVYVCHLPLSTDKDQLTEMFAPYGEITEFKLLVEPKTKAFKGVAFVHFKTHAEARAAIESIDGLQLEGNKLPLECRFAKPNAKMGGPSPRRGGPPHRGPPGRPPPRFRDDRDYYRYGPGGPRDRYDDYGPPPRGGGYGPDRGRRLPPSPTPYSRYDRGPPPGRDWGRRDPYDHEAGRYSPERRFRGPGPEGPPRRRHDPYLEDELTHPPVSSSPAPSLIPVKYDPYGSAGNVQYMPPVGLPK